MRTTVTIDDDLLSSASEFSGISDKSKLINFTLDAYIKKMAARRLAALGGTMPDFDIPGRGGMGSYRGDWSVETAKVADQPR
jgi:Arc/MetJ family transcription regulator